MPDTLAFVLIALPFLAALGCYVFKVSAVRSLIIFAISALLVGGFVVLTLNGPATYSADTMFGIPVRGLIQVADFALLGLILYFGIRHKSALIIVFAGIQLGLAAFLEYKMMQGGHPSHPTFLVDNLAIVMVGVITVVGSAIAIHAIPYMNVHEEHLHLKVSRQPRFFLVFILFLGAMNGLVLANDTTYFYFFWECTTLCSFLLIGHDQTEIATKNAVRALWMNSLGGVAMLVAVVWFYTGLGTLAIDEILLKAPTVAMMTIPLALLCFGAFTRRRRCRSSRGCSAPWWRRPRSRPCCIRARWSRRVSTRCCGLLPLTRAPPSATAWGSPACSRSWPPRRSPSARATARRSWPTRPSATSA